MSKISHLTAKPMQDSRGKWTLETTLVLDDETSVTAKVPGGTSAGKTEVASFAGDEESIRKAIKNVEGPIANAVVGLDPTRQEQIDQTMADLDGTENLSNLGGNAILSVSMACARAAAVVGHKDLFEYIHDDLLRMPDPYAMPVPICNLLEGGVHAHFWIDFQEFHAIPIGLPFDDGVDAVKKIIASLKSLLEKLGLQHELGQEGGFCARLSSNESALEVLHEAIKESRFAREQVSLGLDCAASQFYKDGQYDVKDLGGLVQPEKYSQFLTKLLVTEPIVYLEDPFSEVAEKDWEANANTFPEGVLVTGDDVTTTNPKLVQQAIDHHIIRGLIIKPNQIGTVTKTLEVIKLARANNIKLIISHRAGETDDTFIADLAIGSNAEYVKFGAPVQSQRVAKYDRLFAIEQKITV